MAQNPNRLSKGEVAVGALNIDTGITDTDFVDFATTAATTGAVGRMRWNDTDGTVDLGLKGGNLTIQVGQSEAVPVKHADNAGLAKGAVVYVAGSDGTNKTVRLAQATSDTTSSKTFGVVAETVTGGGKAFCVTFGMLRGLNTSALTEGAVAWLSPTVAGAMTTTKPSAPDHLVAVGFVIRSHATQGVVFVSPQNGYELEELHNVAISNPQNGDVLTYNAAQGLWINQAPA